MKIVITAGELLERGLWEDACTLTGLSPWCVNEGRMDTKETVELTEAQARQLRLLPRLGGEDSTRGDETP